MDDVNVGEVFPQPNVAVEFVTVKSGEVLKLGPTTLRVMEDGSNTDNRLSSGEIIIPPHASGPPAHWHEMHDETFLVTKGTIRFHLPATESGEPERTVDAKEGDYAVVPTRAPHTFSNPTDEESRCFFTCSPAFYMRYFKQLDELASAGVKLGPDVNLKVMSGYATLPADLKKK